MHLFRNAVPVPDPAFVQGARQPHLLRRFPWNLCLPDSRKIRRVSFPPDRETGKAVFRPRRFLSGRLPAV